MDILPEPEAEIVLFPVFELDPILFPILPQLLIELGLGVIDGSGVTDGSGVGLTQGVGVTDGSGVGETEESGVGETEGSGVGDTATEGSGVGVGVTVSMGVGVGVAVLFVPVLAEDVAVVSVVEVFVNVSAFTITNGVK